MGRSETAETVRRNRELQRRFYGEPLGDRLRRLLVALDVSQAALAVALGVSSPMLSQLMSGRRVKIGTPAVFGRLVLLEQAVTQHAVIQHADPAADPAAVERLLADVRATEPTSASTTTPGSYDLLRTVAGPDELARAADTLDRGFPSLAGLLRQAASVEAPDPGR